MHSQHNLQRKKWRGSIVTHQLMHSTVFLFSLSLNWSIGLPGVGAEMGPDCPIIIPNPTHIWDTKLIFNHSQITACFLLFLLLVVFYNFSSNLRGFFAEKVFVVWYHGPQHKQIKIQDDSNWLIHEFKDELS